MKTQLLIGTRKGAWIFRSDAARREWAVDGPHFLGNVVNHLVLGDELMIFGALTGG